MNINSVVNCTFIIRSQAEYSVATQTVILRCLLENAATGERRGFADMDALLRALRAELMELQKKIVPPEPPNSKSVAGTDSIATTPDSAL